MKPLIKDLVGWGSVALTGVCMFSGNVALIGACLVWAVGLDVFIMRRGVKGDTRWRT